MPDNAKTTAQLQTLLADNTSGAISAQDLRDFCVSTINVLNTALQTLQGPLTVTGTATATTFAGSGASLTNLPAASLTGTVNDARLSGNVALTNVPNTFSASQSVTGTLTATSFVGNGGSVANLNALNLTSGTLSDARLSANVAKVNASNTFTANQNVTGTVVATAFSGGGAALTGLDASNVAVGTLSDSRLSSNVALKNVNNNFTTDQTVAGALVTNTFQVNTASPTLTIDINGNLATTGTINCSGTGTFNGVYGVNYGDISNRPSIPATLSELANDVGYITSNTLPTNVSYFTNDAGYLTSVSGDINVGVVTGGSGSFNGDLSSNHTTGVLNVNQSNVRLYSNAVSGEPFTAGNVFTVNYSGYVAATGEVAAGLTDYSNLNSGPLAVIGATSGYPIKLANNAFTVDPSGNVGCHNVSGASGAFNGDLSSSHSSGFFNVTDSNVRLYSNSAIADVLTVDWNGNVSTYGNVQVGNTGVTIGSNGDITTNGNLSVSHSSNQFSVSDSGLTLHQTGASDVFTVDASGDVDCVALNAASIGIKAGGILTFSSGGTLGGAFSISTAELNASSNVIFSGLPTNDPGNPGQLWNNAGVLSVS